jgi:hypothetical protein
MEIVRSTVLDIKGNWITLKGKQLGRKQQIPICITFVLVMLMMTMIPLNSHAHSMTGLVFIVRHTLLGIQHVYRYNIFIPI